MWWTDRNAKVIFSRTFLFLYRYGSRLFGWRGTGESGNRTQPDWFYFQSHDINPLRPGAENNSCNSVNPELGRTSLGPTYKKVPGHLENFALFFANNEIPNIQTRTVIWPRMATTPG